MFTQIREREKTSAEVVEDESHGASEIGGLPKRRGMKLAYYSAPDPLL
jgi:hypothetical protein